MQIMRLTSGITEYLYKCPFCGDKVVSDKSISCINLFSHKAFGKDFLCDYKYELSFAFMRGKEKINNKDKNLNGVNLSIEKIEKELNELLDFILCKAIFQNSKDLYVKENVICLALKVRDKMKKFYQ